MANRVLLQRNPMTGHVYAVTRWHEEQRISPDGRTHVVVVADVKHDVTADYLRLVEAEGDGK